MNFGEGDTTYRGDMIVKIKSAVRPRVPATPEKTQATIEALVAIAAVTFLAHHHVPYSRERAEEIMNIAHNAMVDWLESHEQRN